MHPMLMRSSTEDKVVTVDVTLVLLLAIICRSERYLYNQLGTFSMAKFVVFCLVYTRKHGIPTETSSCSMGCASRD